MDLDIFLVQERFTEHTHYLFNILVTGGDLDRFKIVIDVRMYNI